MSQGSRTAVLKACLLAGSVALGLLMMEAGLRLATGRRYLDQDLRLLTAGLTYVPNQRARWTHIEWDTVVEINSEGFRDEEPAGQDGRPSIVALGDSFTEGYGVDLPQSYAKLLERRLKDAGYPYHVYNAGLQGRSPKDYIQVYDAFFESRKDVKLVTLGFFAGDDVVTRRTAVVGAPDRKNPAYRIKRFLCEHSALYNVIRRPVRQSQRVEFFLQKHGLIGNVRAQSRWSDYRWASRELFHEDWDYTLGLLGAFQQSLTGQGRRLVVVFIPLKEMVGDEHFRHLVELSKLDPAGFDRFGLARYMAEACRKNGIAFLDLTPALVAADRLRPNAYYFKADGHLNPAGHELAARELSRFLVEGRLLKRSR